MKREDLDKPITPRHRRELERMGALPLEHGGHDFHYTKPRLRSVFCPCGAWIGDSYSGGPRPLPEGWPDDKGCGGWGRCPLAGGP